MLILEKTPETFMTALSLAAGSASASAQQSQTPILTDRVTISPTREATPEQTTNQDTIIISSPDRTGASRQDLTLKLESLGNFIREFGNALTVENGGRDIAISMSHLSGLITMFFNFTVTADWCKDVFRSQ